MQLSDSFLNECLSAGIAAGRRRGFLSPQNQLRYHLEKFFADHDLTGTSVLDVGAGKGLLSLAAAEAGATNVVCLEPEGDGSESRATERFHRALVALDLSHAVERRSATLQEFARTDPGARFDLIVLGNSINHLDEDACVNLLTDPHARQRFVDIFSNLYTLSNAGATVIMTDCARNNLLGNRGLPNPVAAGIEWEKHQDPDVWAELATTVGFVDTDISWTSFDQLGKFGEPLSHPQIAQVLRSHFRLQFRRPV